MLTDKELRQRFVTEGAPLLFAHIRELNIEILHLRAWVADLQSGMFINCVYCGHRYGLDPGTPVSMADVLKAHIEVCPDHPMAALKKAVDRLAILMTCDMECWRSSQIHRSVHQQYNGHYLDCAISQRNAIMAELKIPTGNSDADI